MDIPIRRLRVRKSERFTWQLTMLLHCFPDDGPIDRRVQVAELDYIASSEAAPRAIAENYVGLSLWGCFYCTIFSLPAGAALRCNKIPPALGGFSSKSALTL